MDNEERITSITESVLNSVKKLLGLEPDDACFDEDVIMNINSALAILFQVGVGNNMFMITGSGETYDEFLSDPTEFGMVKMFLFYKTKLSFDSESMSGALIEQYRSGADELLWRLQAYEEHKDAFNS